MWNSIRRSLTPMIGLTALSAVLASPVRANDSEIVYQCRVLGSASACASLRTQDLVLAACATGEHIKKAQLVCRKAGKEQQEFLTIKFEDLLISSYQTGGSAHGRPPWRAWALAITMRSITRSIECFSCFFNVGGSSSEKLSPFTSTRRNPRALASEKSSRCSPLR